MTKAAAAIAGLMFSRSEANIWRAMVVWFGPATKSVITTSSSDVAKEKTAPVRMPAWQAAG